MRRYSPSCKSLPWPEDCESTVDQSVPPQQTRQDRTSATRFVPMRLLQQSSSPPCRGSYLFSRSYVAKNFPHLDFVHPLALAYLLQFPQMSLNLRGRDARLFGKAAPPQMLGDHFRFARFKPFQERHQLPRGIVNFDIVFPCWDFTKSIGPNRFRHILCSLFSRRTPADMIKNECRCVRLAP